MFSALAPDYTNLSLEDAFTLQNDFEQWRSSGQHQIQDHIDSSSWYPGNQEWMPGVRQILEYMKFFRKLRINTNNRGFVCIHEFWRMFPASYVFEESCHIKYQVQMYWEMAQDHERNTGAKWSQQKTFFTYRPY